MKSTKTQQQNKWAQNGDSFILIVLELKWFVYGFNPKCEREREITTPYDAQTKYNKLYESTEEKILLLLL